MKNTKYILYGLSILISIVSVILDVIWNCINGWLMILFFLPVILMPFVEGMKRFRNEFVFLTIGMAIWIYTETLISKINQIEISLMESQKGRFLVFMISLFGLNIIFRYILNTPLKTFISNVKNILFIPKILKSFFYLLISYFSITFIFTLLYASIFVFVNNSVFIEGQPLFIDFFFYSAFIPTTYSYPGLTPNHSIIGVLTLIQLFLGLFITIVYLGVIVGQISNRISSNPELFE